MAELMNWPPSRGPNPGHYQVSYQQGKVTRQDVEMPPPGTIDYREVKRAKPVGKWFTWFQVDDVITLSLEQAVNILRGRKYEGDSDFCADDWYQEKLGTLETIIDYPLGMAVHLIIEPMTVTRTWGRERPPKVSLEMRLGYFLWVVAHEYMRIYEEYEKYGVWGHAMSDLGFEGVIVRKDGTADLLIGS